MSHCDFFVSWRFFCIIAILYFAIASIFLSFRLFFCHSFLFFLAAFESIFVDIGVFAVDFLVTAIL